ncbi:MAG: hypothetical protein P0Y65_20635 [Candidatus Devosia phytovorans]|uniref:Uncharacterized protein n=1 Tax=Candidatus Devosia phytovorans TaxID=3121372 RepID=A0AAJ6AZG2_9HYPH|nr:hypothetical protein [Devosia sp.]WEK04550.1 MAG: hypothetical protein P0Y65_20635 [Devosia sp.]
MTNRKGLAIARFMTLLRSQLATDEDAEPLTEPSRIPEKLAKIETLWQLSEAIGLQTPDLSGTHLPVDATINFAMAYMAMVLPTLAAGEFAAAQYHARQASLQIEQAL